MEKTRYSDAELEEFKAIILEKLAKAQKEYDELRSVVSNADGNDVNETSPTFKTLEEGALTLAKEAHGCNWCHGNTVATTRACMLCDRRLSIFCPQQNYPKSIQ